ncbi:MAG: DUF6973 domain-containing protein [Bacteroidota bacterium]
MKATLFLVSFLFLSVKTEAQSSAFSSFWKLSCPEKWWVFTHPFVAKNAFKITAEARIKSDSLISASALDGDPFGGQIDAFRHAYWMARLAQKMKWKKALKLGIAHEKANKISFRKNHTDEEGLLPDSVSSAMDLYNNEVGVAIGCNFKLMSRQMICDSVIEKIRSGRLKVILKNEQGRELKCDGTEIDKSEYAGKWNIPKCLVSSDSLFK